MLYCSKKDWSSSLSNATLYRLKEDIVNFRINLKIDKFFVANIFVPQQRLFLFPPLFILNSNFLDKILVKLLCSSSIKSKQKSVKPSMKKLNFSTLNLRQPHVGCEPQRDASQNLFVDHACSNFLPSIIQWEIVSLCQDWIRIVFFHRWIIDLSNSRNNVVD